MKETEERRKQGEELEEEKRRKERKKNKVKKADRSWQIIWKIGRPVMTGRPCMLEQVQLGPTGHDRSDALAGWNENTLRPVMTGRVCLLDQWKKTLRPVTTGRMYSLDCLNITPTGHDQSALRKGVLSNSGTSKIAAQGVLFCKFRRKRGFLL